MSFLLGLAQVYRSQNDAELTQAANHALDTVRAFAEKATALGVDLLVFPEFLMTPLAGAPDGFRRAAQPLDGPFAKAAGEIAAANKIWIIFTMNQQNDSRPSAKPLNTAVVVDPAGAVRGTYSKNHLFDLNPIKESDYMEPGNSLLAPVSAPFAKFSMGICYDLRFPEIAEAAASQGASLMLYPAGWADGPSKADQWRALLAERALQTGMHVAGVSLAGPGYIGQSCVYAPDGTQLAAAGRGEELLVCEIG